MQVKKRSLPLALVALILIVSIASSILHYERRSEVKFIRISPYGWHLKDSYSFLHNGEEYMLCTDISSGGLALLKKEDGLFQGYSNILRGERAWAPVIFGDYIFYAWAPQNMSDEYALLKGMSIYYLRYDVSAKSVIQMPKKLLIPKISEQNGEIGAWIDPEIVSANGTFTLFIANLWHGFDIDWCHSQNLLGPYTTPRKLETITEYGVEEAPRFDSSMQVLYWSVGKSDYGSSIRMGQLALEPNMVWVQETSGFEICALDCVTCTHPDLAPSGSLRATLRKTDGWWFIGEFAMEGNREGLLWSRRSLHAICNEKMKLESKDTEFIERIASIETTRKERRELDWFE